jgi:unspecific monooxygenase
MQSISTSAQITAVDERRALRATLSQFATGVAIATVQSDGRRSGLTINSLASVSLDPPLVVWSLASTASSLPTFEDVPFHAINVLAAGQGNLALRFAARGVERFAGVEYRDGPYRTVLIEGALAHIVCRLRDVRETGDHTMLVSEVVHHRAFPGRPLIFQTSRYWTTGERLNVEALPAALAQL